MPRHGSLGYGVISALALALGACAHTATSTPPAGPPAAWVDAPLLGASADEADELVALARGDRRARQVRLDRLLDLFDAARFGQDEDARETLWTALGGHVSGVGEQASRDALQRLLQEALALEEDARRADDHDAASLSADAIMMLSTDLQTPGTAEDLSIRTLVYRTLAREGHERLRDNARWRLYDHVWGTLAGAVEVPPEQRLEVAVQALYAERDSVEELLADAAPHARPPWPATEQLWALLEAQRAPLTEIPRWAPVMERRAGDDDQLHDTLRTALPAPRPDDWPLSSLPAGTARPESLAPVLRVEHERLVVDAGRSHARTVALDTDIIELSRAIGNALAQDGRGTVLLVADPTLPAPQLRTVLRAVRRAAVERLELAVREPRVDPKAGEVVVALPVYVTHAGGQRPGDKAWAETRVHVHLDGRGPQVAVDGHWLAERPAGPRALRTQIEQVARAYPRERGVVVSLDGDVQLQQVLELLAAVQGGPQRPFAAVGWMADGWRPTGAADGDAWLRRRAALAWTEPRMELEQPYPLQEQDQKRLEGFAEHLAVCLPELRAATV
ncbi:MAG: hypothetical protein KDK70_38920, partial [Myxococcales bacterium]|nr:hypothetical protein [Myxococcales bacterium]